MDMFELGYQICIIIWLLLFFVGRSSPQPHVPGVGVSLSRHVMYYQLMICVKDLLDVYRCLCACHFKQIKNITVLNARRHIKIYCELITYTHMWGKRPSSINNSLNSLKLSHRLHDVWVDKGQGEYWWSPLWIRGFHTVIVPYEWKTPQFTSQ